MAIPYAGTHILDDNVTTAFELPGMRVVRSLGIARGVVVRSCGLFGKSVGHVQSAIGGRVSTYTSLCERTRTEAYALCLRHGREIGGNALIGMRYDANAVASGVTEVICYGTAVVVEPLPPG